MRWVVGVLKKGIQGSHALATSDFLISDKLNVELLPIEISSIRRLGKPHAQPRPVCLEVISEKKKYEILSNSSKLKGTKIGVSMDFHQDIVNERKKLRPFFIEAKKQGQQVKMVGDKLWLNGKTLSLQDLKKFKSGTANELNYVELASKKRKATSPLAKSSSSDRVSQRFQSSAGSSTNLS
ncbi:hypothetical protein O3M35_010021 [Rhynocoris fuscipes]|uniref:Uncharacterized protein n=1 Tax=Rhynocoris fuscipes TaxID=488301 RepID=A0AAW1D556_9HEMI